MRLTNDARVYAQVRDVTIVDRACPLPSRSGCRLVAIGNSSSVLYVAAPATDCWWRHLRRREGCGCAGLASSSQAADFGTQGNTMYNVEVSRIDYQLDAVSIIEPPLYVGIVWVKPAICGRTGYNAARSPVAMASHIHYPATHRCYRDSTQPLPNLWRCTMLPIEIDP